MNATQFPCYCAKCLRCSLATANCWLRLLNLPKLLRYLSPLFKMRSKLNNRAVLLQTFKKCRKHVTGQVWLGQKHAPTQYMPFLHVSIYFSLSHASKKA